MRKRMFFLIAVILILLTMVNLNKVDVVGETFVLSGLIQNFFYISPSGLFECIGMMRLDRL